MVFARVCIRKGADPDTMETLMEYTKVLGHRQIVFKSDQENPVKAVQRACSSATRDESGEEPKVSFSSKRHGGKRSAARDWVDLGAERRTKSQHQTSGGTDYTSDDVHGEPRGRKSSTDSLWTRMARRRRKRPTGPPQTQKWLISGRRYCSSPGRSTTRGTNST